MTLLTDFMTFTGTSRPDHPHTQEAKALPLILSMRASKTEQKIVNFCF